MKKVYILKIAVITVAFLVALIAQYHQCKVQNSKAVKKSQIAFFPAK